MDGMEPAAVTLTMTPGELRITRNALHAFLNDFGHDEDEVIEAVREALLKVEDALGDRGATPTADV